jgi:penicillin amidase
VSVGVRRPRRNVTAAKRIDAFPARLPVTAPVAVHWTHELVPFVEAQSDRDLAVALGAVHGHLRLGQIETMRLLAHGRLSSVVGRPAVDIDHLLRLLDVGKAVPEIEANLPEETRTWMAGFADGLNAAIEQGERPQELEMLGIEPAPWTVHELLVLSRLASMDFTWKVWLRLLPLRRQSAWDAIWQRLIGREALSVPGMAGNQEDAAETVVAGLSRSGSNCFALDGRRTATSAPILASDPHLPIVLPNLWLLAGFSAPGHNAVGLMIPGLPAVGLGRNPWGAWGGTSLHAASSDLFDVSGISQEEIETDEIEIPVRGSRPARFTRRSTRYGPIVSDAARLGADPERPLALRWVGHDPSDEMTAFLGVHKARNWDDFARALEGFAVPAQNMIFAEDPSGGGEGRVGQMMAAHLPRRPRGTPRDMVTPPDALSHWRHKVTGADLPRTVEPEAGYVASANNAPAQSTVTISHFFSSDERIGRLRQLLGGSERLDRDAVGAIHGDVLVPSARRLRDALLAAIDAAGDPKTARAPIVEALRDWDGAYRESAAGALAFELILYRLIAALHGERTDMYLATWDVMALLREDLEETPRERLADAACAAVAKAQPRFAKLRTWGNAHRLYLSHPFGRLPLVGRRFRLPEMPVAGSNETLMKTGFGMAGDRHRVRFGANARFVADLADPDENRFALLGGQDGWIGSDCFADQVPLWRRNETLRLPLRAETWRRTRAHTVYIQSSETQTSKASPSNASTSTTAMSGSRR